MISEIGKAGWVQFAEDNMRGLFMANLSSIGVALSAYVFLGFFRRPRQ